MAVILLVGSVSIGVIDGRVAAGMTVGGLASAGYTLAMLSVPWVRISQPLRALVWMAVAICVVSLVVAAAMHFAHEPDTAAFVVAFGAAMVFGGASLYGAVRG